MCTFTEFKIYEENINILQTLSGICKISARVHIYRLVYKKSINILKTFSAIYKASVSAPFTALSTRKA